MRELREYKKYKNRALVSKVNEGVFMNNYFVLLWKMQKQKHFRCAQNEFKIYVFKTCKIAIRFFCLFMQFHFMLLSTNTEGFQPSQNTIGKPQVYMNFFIIQIYCHALIFIENRSLLCIFSFKVYRDILKYIGILDLVRVGLY